MGDGDDLVQRYLMDLCPEEMQHALRALAAIEYPVDDAVELESRLREDKRKPGLLSLLQPVDFPLAGPRNAFDKLAARTRSRVLPPGVTITQPSLPDPDEFDVPAERVVPPLEYYLGLFVPLCAERAFAEYVSQRKETDHERATAKGEKKGEECEGVVSELRRWWTRPTTDIPSRLGFPPG